MKSLFGAFALLLLPLPVQANELAVRASPTQAKLYQSVVVTVQGAEAGLQQPPLVTLTIADARDRRQTLPMLPAGPGKWQGRFTPQSLGRHTGTVVMEMGEDREIGLVPAIDVRTSTSRGFVRKVAAGGRMFECDGGGLFPMGMTIPGAAGSDAAWQDEFARLRGYGVNYVRMELPWDPTFPATSAEPKAAEAADRWLVAAEKAGLFVHLRLTAPRGTDPTSRAAYGRLLELAADRWGPLASLAAWEVDPTPFRKDDAALKTALGVLRARDTQRHLVTLLAQTATDRAWNAGADFVVTRQSLLGAKQPVPASPTPVLVLGAASVDPWAGLFAPGLGIPLAAHRPGMDPAWELPELPAVAALAKTVPWDTPARAAVARSASDPGESVQWLAHGDVVLLRAQPRADGDGPDGDPGVRAVIRGVAPGARLRVFRADGSVARQETLTPEGGEVTVHLREPGRRAVVAAITADPPVAALKPGLKRARGTKRR